MYIFGVSKTITVKKKIMKKHSTTLFIQINQEQTKSLTNITAEIVAENIEIMKSKIFSAADLWNIQCQKKKILQRRYSF